MKRRATTIAGLAAMTCAGVVAALALASSAAAWDWTNLPNGYSVSGSSYQKADGSSCHIVKIDGRLMGDDCVDAAAMYAAIDAYVNSTICTVNPAAGGSACVTTTNAPPAAPPGTTTTTTTPADTIPAPATTTTAAAAPVAPTTTSSVDDEIAQLNARITALEQQIAALNTRVDRIGLAGDASWLAFEKAVAGGADIPTAADIARGTYLDAEYGLGQFAA